MHPTTQARWPRCCAGLILAAGLAGAAATGPLAAQQPAAQQKAKDAQIGDVKIDAKTGALVVPTQATVRFNPGLRKDEILTDILNTNEGVVFARTDPTNPDFLLLTGRAPGVSRLSLMLKDKPRRDFDVVVQADLNMLRNLIRRTVPTANVEVTPGIGNTIILSGYVTSPQDSDLLLRLAISQIGAANNVINATQVGGVQQVQLDVVIASVDRSEARSRGFDFAVNTRTTQFASIVSGLLTPPTGGSGGFGFATFSPNANIQLGLVPAQFFGALQALRTENVAKFLAEPRIVTQTGRPAQFRSGGQQAILGPSSGINGPGVVLVPFGTEVDVLPIVYGNNQIWLEVNPRVTAVSQGLGITTVFGSTPGFTEQTARCAVMLESGQTFAIGGLIQNTVQASSARVPVLGDLPYLGTLFSRVNYTETETELVILVTPRLVASLDCNQVPRRLPGRETRTPDDYELFLEGILEAPRGQRKVWNGRCYNAAYKCDPTVASMPCVGNLCTGPGSLGIGLPGSNCGPNGCAAPAFSRVPGVPVRTMGPSVAPNAGPPAILPQAPPLPMPPRNSAPATLPAVGPMQEATGEPGILPVSPYPPRTPVTPVGSPETAADSQAK